MKSLGQVPYTGICGELTSGGLPTVFVWADHDVAD